MTTSPKNRKLIKKNSLVLLGKDPKTNYKDLSKYLGKPEQFAHEVLGIERLTSEIIEVYQSLLVNRITNVKAAHGVGKSFGVAAFILYYVFVEEGMVFATAPTEDQLKDVLWKEVRVLYDRAKHLLGGSRNVLSVTKTESSKAIGFTARDNNADSFQGKHAAKMLLIQEEANGISNTIDEAFNACIVSVKNRGLRIGNPVNAGSAFAKNCALSCLTIPAWTHPNVAWAYEKKGKYHRLKPEVAKQILSQGIDLKQYLNNPETIKTNDPIDYSKVPPEVIPGAISVPWIEETRIKYGEGSLYWQTRVEAEFPTDDSEGIIPISWLHDAVNRYEQNPDKYDKAGIGKPWRIGVDVGDGIDNHAISTIRGSVLYGVDYHKTKGDRQDVVRLANDIVSPLIRRLGGLYVVAVDSTGVGSGTLGTLLACGYNAKPCVFGGGAKDKVRFKNRKTELLWKFRDLLRLGEIAISPFEEMDRVFEELTSIKYSILGDKTIAAEPKETTRSRLGRSPDGADSIIIALETSDNSSGEVLVQEWKQKEMIF